ncbi:MAG: ABC transporter ATP-binding protein [Chloroflexi bacterium]|nr:ABC transporter ATP-binding protein [Chloroflexota bacterium]
MANETQHVSLQGLSHVFTDGREPLHVLDDVSIDVPHGQFTSIIGPSGCGKSTLLRIVGGLLEPSVGLVRIDGAGPREAQRRHDIGIVFQEPALLPWRTVAANVRLPLEIDRGRRRSTEAESLLELVGLDEFRDYYPHQLSGGMAQRVAIARALAVDPTLLLMDEPFGALDEITRSSMRYELLRIWASQAKAAARKTVLFVTHSITEAIVMSDRIIVINGRPGRVVADAAVELPRPRTQEIERSAPFLDYADHLRGLLDGAAA